MSVTDKLGLVNENSYLVVYFPATGTAIPFRVVSRVNKGFEAFDYGPLPITTTMFLASYDGGTVSPPASGVLPARSYTSDLAFPAIPGTPLANVRDTSDIWYLDENDRDRLFHVKMLVYPPVIRIDIRIPASVAQLRFQKDRAIIGVDTVLGFARGVLEFIRFPYLRYGLRFGNDTNLSLYTFVRFIYAEYVVEIPRDEELIANILSRKVPSHWLTMPISYKDPSIVDALRRVYGFTAELGFKLYRADERERAVADYKKVLSELKV
jgi:hypothetical protein